MVRLRLFRPHYLPDIRTSEKKKKKVYDPRIRTQQTRMVITDCGSEIFELGTT